MSDQHVWPAHHFTPQVSAVETATRVSAAAQQVGNLVHLFKGDTNEPIRSWLLGMVGSLDKLSEEVQASQTVTGGASRRVPGEQTNPNVKRMRSNRGGVHRSTP